jgi:hypothetical protein
MQRSTVAPPAPSPVRAAAPPRRDRAIRAEFNRVIDERIADIQEAFSDILLNPREAS